MRGKAVREISRRAVLPTEFGVRLLSPQYLQGDVMKHLVCLGGLWLCGLLASLSAFADPVGEAAPISFGETLVFESVALGEARSVNVWVPPGGSEDERAPYRVLYLIDGGTAQDWFHIAGLAQLGALSWTFEPMIVVGIETDDRQNELTPYPARERYVDEFPTAGEADAFRAFITDEVAPYIARTYPVSGKRAVIGESLAGLFIVDTFLKAPDTFDDYIAISPSLWWDNKALSAQAGQALADGDYDGKRLYLTIGDEGGSMQAAMEQLVLALKAAAPDGLSWRYVDRSASETHSTIYHGAALDAFRTFYAAPPYEYGETPWYLVEDDTPE